LNIDKIVIESVESHCKKNGYSQKLTKLMLDLTKKYRNEGTVNDKELLSYIQRIQKSLPDAKGGE